MNNEIKVLNQRKKIYNSIIVNKTYAKILNGKHKNKIGKIIRIGELKNCYYNNNKNKYYNHFNVTVLINNQKITTSCRNIKILGGNKMINNKKIYSLTEAFEGDDGIRQFEILATSFDEEKLKIIMQEEIKEDKHELIKNNGIETNSDTYFETYFNNGFVQYAIVETEVI